MGIFMFKRLTLVFSLFIFVLSFASEAFAVSDRCPRHVVKTKLKAKKYKTQFLSGDLRGINDYLGSHSVLAFVENPIDVQTFYNFSLKEVGNGKVCVMLDAVKAEYISAPKLVMPSDIPRRSCEYKIIRKHEQRHIDVHNKYYDKSVNQYKAFLGRTARRVPILPPVNSSEGIDAIQQEIMKYFDEKFYERVNKSVIEMMKMQSKIDSSQEYTFTNRRIDRCNKLEERKKKKNKKTFHDHNYR